MTAELISVGTEILMGNILNSNARYLAEKCASLGLDMYYQVTVGDNYDRMMAVVKTALDRSDIVIAASYWGKFKTTFQMIAVILMIFNIPALATVTMIMLVIAVVLTVISLVDYVAKNIEVLTKGGM